MCCGEHTMLLMVPCNIHLTVGNRGGFQRLLITRIRSNSFDFCISISFPAIAAWSWLNSKNVCTQISFDGNSCCQYIFFISYFSRLQSTPSHYKATETQRRYDRMCLLLKKNRVNCVLFFSYPWKITDIRHCFLSLGQQLNSSIVHLQELSGICGVSSRPLNRYTVADISA